MKYYVATLRNAIEFTLIKKEGENLVLYKTLH